ncbi:hypothetical protein EVAR_8800_1 [Eumeta japonica]|uniref:Uncharacterized protein n=1 Tax=Eumeta variegata TaxID=151549 RepID=A0A4C1TUI0_EUMVA|nr:hypothetical protein EVAR_8800_1 [Eumeta japonica]
MFKIVAVFTSAYRKCRPARQTAPRPAPRLRSKTRLYSMALDEAATTPAAAAASEHAGTGGTVSRVPIEPSSVVLPRARQSIAGAAVARRSRGGRAAVARRSRGARRRTLTAATDSLGLPDANQNPKSVSQRRVERITHSNYKGTSLLLLVASFISIERKRLQLLALPARPSKSFNYSTRLTERTRVCPAAGVSLAAAAVRPTQRQRKYFLNPARNRLKLETIVFKYELQLHRTWWSRNDFVLRALSTSLKRGCLQCLTAEGRSLTNCLFEPSTGARGPSPSAPLAASPPAVSLIAGDTFRFETDDSRRGEEIRHRRPHAAARTASGRLPLSTLDAIGNGNQSENRNDDRVRDCI